MSESCYYCNYYSESVVLCLLQQALMGLSGIGEVFLKQDKIYHLSCLQEVQEIFATDWER